MALAEALHVSNSLESLLVFGNDFEQESGGMFHELINNRLKYTGLQLDIDVYVVDGTYMIADKQ